MTETFTPRRPIDARRGLRALASAIGLASALLIMLLAACGRGDADAVDIYQKYRPALKADHQGIFDSLAPMPRYDLDVELDAENSVLTGTASIFVPNTTQDSWNDLVFRLYPTLEQYGGFMTFRGASVNGQPVTYGYAAENTALRMQLTAPIAPGEDAQIELRWKLVFPTWTDSPSIYALFGVSHQITSLPLFYPSIAVYEEGPFPDTGRWWNEIGDIRGDAAYNLSSLFAVTITMDANLVPVTSGTLVTSTVISADKIRYSWASGPSREFLLHYSPLLQSAQTDAYGTRVTSFWLPGEESSGRAALRFASASLRIYSDLFGAYPYRDMRVAPATLSFRGMEYPQVNLIGIELYNRYREDLETLVAHEVAHQWWYQMVHNDPVNTPWLDEALAEYSMKLYLEQVYGKAEADALHFSRWQVPYNNLVTQNADVPISQPVKNFESGGQYEAIVYGKGALFYEAMRDRLGEQQFRRFLRTYLEDHQFGIITENSWLEALTALDDPELLALYNDWIKQAPDGLAPLTNPEPTPSAVNVEENVEEQ